MTRQTSIRLGRIVQSNAAEYILNESGKLKTIVTAKFIMCIIYAQYVL